jgi:hypothetical protein
MGGAVKAVGDVVGGVGGLASSAAGAIPGIGPIAGPIVGGITGGPVGFAKAVASQAIQGNYSGGGGGGGGGDSGGIPTYGATDAAGNLIPATPGFNYGANTYTYDNKPYDASKYFVSGNKGVYNVLPELGNMYSPEAQAAQGTAGFNAYQNIYGKMAGDELAQANLQRSFNPGMLSVAPQSGAYKPIGDFNPATTPYAGGRADLPGYLQEDIKSAYGEYQPQAQSSGSSYLPIQYADFGFGSEDQTYKLAQYAAQNKNPFFQAFASPQQEAAPTMANPFAFAKPPEAPAPAPSPYQPVEGGAPRGPAERSMVPATTASMGTFRPVEASTATPTSVATARRPEEYKPVNIRTGGLASLRRSK